MGRAPSNSSGTRRLDIEGVIPGAGADDAKTLRTRLRDEVSGFIRQCERYGYPLEPFDLQIKYANAGEDRTASDARQPVPPSARARPVTEAAAQRPPSPPDEVPEFIAVEPSFRLDQVVLPVRTREALLDCVEFINVAPLVFGTWGLSAIEPHPSIAVNFRGPPGTGKTMAAHAAASYLGKKILFSRVSDLESKYHGQGPKNLFGLFESAKNQDAVIFIDEAESLLSRRYAQPEQAAESAINSMRTELLMALDAFNGLVIFASNLPDSYDFAIDSRLQHVDFDLPDRMARLAIWQLHFPPGLPLEPGYSIDRLADIDGVSGRDIKLAVIRAAVSTARKKEQYVTERALIEALASRRGTRSRAETPVALAGEEMARQVRARLDANPS
jgi:SpoVK/Ycf46/Vps4 family AAA+-type ATPase